MLKKIIMTSAIVVALVIQAGIAFAENKGVKMIEDAIETNALKIIYDLDKRKGEITGKICDQCQPVTVKITPETQAFANGKKVSMAEAKKRFGKPATVFFNIESKEVTKISW